MNPMRHIRKQVFGVTQQEFAAIAGVQQSTVSRWERGEAAPSLAEMGAIRSEAKARRKRWSDAMFFDAPTGAGKGVAA